MKLGSFISVIDVESTCWENPSFDQRSNISEIIEIGISVVDVQSLSVVSSNSILVKPEYSQVSEFCTQLTTLTQEQVDTGITFPEAAELLKSKFDSKNSFWASWGDYDRKMFENMTKLHNIRYPLCGRHMNLKYLFALLKGLDKEVELKSAVELSGLTFEGTHHRGDSDSKNISNVLIEMLKQYRNLK